MCQNKDDLLFLAKIYEETEEYGEMYIIMRNIAYNYSLDNLQERNLFIIACKNIINHKMSNSRTISFYESREGQEQFQILLKKYNSLVQSEIQKICEEIIETIDLTISPKINEDDYETQVAFIKMRGNMLKYKFDAIGHLSLDQIKQKTEILECYYSGYKIAIAHLNTASIARMSLIINYTEYLFNTMQQHKEAAQLIKQACEDLSTVLMDLEDNQDRVNLVIIYSILKDNYTLFSECDCEQCKPSSD